MSLSPINSSIKYFGTTIFINGANAESTIKRKHSDVPLSDTDLLGSSIKAKVRNKNGGVAKVVRTGEVLVDKFKPAGVIKREAQS